MTDDLGSDNITVCIFAFNEADRIERCLANFRRYRHVLVLDNFSTDETRQVVERAGVRCVTLRNPGGFVETPEVMDPLFERVSTEYLLLASVSEFVPLALMRRYDTVADGQSHDVVRTYRVSITAGLPIPIVGNPRPWNKGFLRFFRKGSLSFAGNQVHEAGTIVVDRSRVLNLVTDPDGRFYQFRDYDASHTEKALCRYNDTLARQRFEAGQRFSWVRAISCSVWAFVKSWLLFGSFRHGMPGFIHSYYRGQMEFTLWLRVWEWQHGFRRADVIARNDAVRRRLEETQLRQPERP
jgi:glycosyltransferase involved in cell wall biosynthesis